MIEKIYKLSPFGLGNPLPVFVSNEVEITRIRNIGKNGQHLKLQLKTNNKAESTKQEAQDHALKLFEALIWNHDSKIQFTIGDKIEIVYTPKLNHFNGETFIQLEIKDWENLKRRGERTKWREDKETRQGIEIYNFRGKTQECLDLLSSRQESVTYFAEIEQKNHLPLKTTSRNNISKAKNLVFLEPPPDESTFTNIIKLSNAEKIYFSFTLGQTHEFVPMHLLKNLIGLLKYTVSNKNSIVSESNLMSALGINKSALAFALEILVKIGFLTYKRNFDQLSINISTPSRQNFNDLIEYNLLTSELKQITKFTAWICESNLTEVVQMLEKNNIQAAIVRTEITEVVL